MLLSRFFDRRHVRSSRPVARRRLSVEALEGRQLLATFTVTNVNDSGPGSLRQAIINSDASTGSVTNTIRFDISGGGTQTIALESALPEVTHAVTIDGTTQPGTGPAPRVVLDGAGAGVTAVGLVLVASQTTVKGLAVDGFATGGVLVDGASGDVVTHDDLGVKAAGNVAAGNGYGVTLQAKARDTTISHDVISGNKGHGVVITGAGTTGNVVVGCDIGTNASGTAALGNGYSGVLIQDGADANVIGGTAAGDANVLSGNGLRGVHIQSGADHNVVEGNFIGTNANGTAALGNTDSGVLISSSDDNVIGGTAPGAGNTIAANGQRGVHIDAGSSGNVVLGNFIGTTAGAAALGNTDSGVLISSSDDNVIGGTAPGAGNTIAANKGDGIDIDDGSLGNVVLGNLIGTNAAGSSALGNALSGIYIQTSAADNIIGTTAAGAGNTISYNRDNGVELDGAGVGNFVEGNAINANGFAQPTAGLGDGVSLIGSPYSTVTDNTIEWNRDWGIDSVDRGHSILTGNTFQGNGLGNTHST